MRISDLKHLFKRVYQNFAIFANDKRLYQLSTAITAGTTTTTAPTGSFGVTSHATGANKLFVSNGTVWTDAGKGAAVYKAVIAQAGTAAPTATVIENTLGGTVVLARSGVGVYTFTLVGAFVENKTFFNIQVETGATAVMARAARTSADVITVTTATEAAVAADLVGNLHLEITVNP